MIGLLANLLMTFLFWPISTIIQASREASCLSASYRSSGKAESWQ